MSTIDVTLRMTTITCCHAGCGITFAVPDWWNETRREDRSWWYCPNGHSQHFIGETEAEKLRRQVAEKDRLLSVRQTQLDDSRKYAETLERSNRSIRAHTKRLKTRAAAGICPAGCKRHFTNLQRHIATKHPSWKAEEEK